MIPLRDTIRSRRPPVATWGLLALNTAVFLYELTLPEPALQQLFYTSGLVPARFTDPGWALSVGLTAGSLWPFLTSMFLHGGFFHLISNMWMLWIFGDNVEDRMGPLRFLAFYVVCGVAAGLVQALSGPGSRIPTVGASGAIAGVLGAYFVLYPAARVVTLIPVFFWPLFVELPAFIVLGIWFLSQVVSGSAAAAAGTVGGIAWWAHVGGFAAGLLLFRGFLRRRLRIS